MKDALGGDDLIREYLAECREHLSRIESDLLEVEQAGANSGDELVNRVFRAAHSIKGGAAFFDLHKIRELAHRTENVLDMIRSRQMVPDVEIVSVLLMAFDRLKELIENHQESNDADIAEMLGCLTGLTCDHLPAGQKQALTEHVSIALSPARQLIQTTAFDLTQARTGGKSIYVLEYDLIHDVQRKGKTPLELLNSLMRCGTLIEVVLDWDAVGTLESSSAALPLEVLYATPFGSELIAEFTGLAADKIQIVDQKGTARALNSPAPEAAAPEAPAPPAAPPLKREPASKSTGPSRAEQDATIRLSVTLLDSLMTLAGELVLSRNQLNESLSRGDQRGIRTGAQRLSLATSELQEVVTLTRMQPVGSIFGKFSRVVRDLARDLGKEVQLQIEGNDVEIDKTILEGLSDPLTHMVRNAVDHGIETPQRRTAAGKPLPGTISLKASHQAGQVVIELSDDGRGLDADKVAESAVKKGQVPRDQALAMTDREKMALIFLPGVSTAEKVSDVSGRGVGMDVVKTNLDRLGGKIEIDSTPGQGTAFRIKLPLTLAIIPSLLISVGGQRFAIPQISVGELIRIRAAEFGERIGQAAGAEVLTLRDRLVPLVRLAGLFGQQEAAGQALNVVLVDTGAFQYGLVVEDLHDTAEIVVKPLGRHLQSVRDFAGATILGDGRVAVILDVAELAARANLSASQARELSRQLHPAEASGKQRHSLLLFSNASEERCAVPIELVSRIERIRPQQVEHLGGRRSMQYRGASMPVVSLCDVAAVGEIASDQSWVVVVFEIGGRSIGLLAAEPLDMMETELELDTVTLRQPGISGSAILKDRTTLMVNIFEIAERVRPEGEPMSGAVDPAVANAAGQAILVAEDSDFFRGQIRRLIEAVGYRVIDACDGQAAWEILDGHAGEVALVATDIEMPRMDGLSLTRRIRGDGRFDRLPVIALSSLAGEEEMAHGLAAGVSEYQVKLDPEQLVEGIRRQLAAATH
jgi:two-component system chemotaxis sensor kinase CheA